MTERSNRLLPLGKRSGKRRRVEHVHWAPDGFAACRELGRLTPAMGATTCPTCKELVVLAIELELLSVAPDLEGQKTGPYETCDGDEGALPGIAQDWQPLQNGGWIDVASFPPEAHR